MKDMPKISEKKDNKIRLQDKKILFLITQTKWGGAQKYVLELAEHFNQHNEVHIAYGEIKNKDTKFFEICASLKIKTIPVTSLIRKIDLSKDFLAVPEILKILNTNIYDLIHLNSSKAGLLGSLAAKLYSLNPMNSLLRVFYTAHGFVFNEPLSKFRKKIYKISETISTNLQHAIITVSEQDKQSAITNKVAPENNMFTIHNGINPNKYFFYSQSEALNKLKLSPDKKYFGTIASFYKTKGYQYLIEAIQILKDDNSPLLQNHIWILIGDGPELETIQQQVKDNNLNQYIKFISAKDNAWQYLLAFNYFILPSVKEGLPYTILEAGLAKIPIIASRVGGIPEILEDNQTGLLITPANPLALITAMEKLSKDHNLAEKLKNNNYQNIKDNFDLKDTLRKTEELYLKTF